MTKGHMALRKIEIELTKRSERALGQELNEAKPDDFDMIGSFDRTIGYLDPQDRTDIDIHVDDIKMFFAEIKLKTSADFVKYYANDVEKWVDDIKRGLQLHKDDATSTYLFKKLHEKYLFLIRSIKPSIYKKQSTRYMKEKIVTSADEVFLIYYSYNISCFLYFVYVVLIFFSYCFDIAFRWYSYSVQMFFIYFSYCVQLLFRLYSYTVQMFFIYYSYFFHIIFILHSDVIHILFIFY